MFTKEIIGILFREAKWLAFELISQAKSLLSFVFVT